MEIKHPAKPNSPQTPMKNLLVKLLPLLAIVIATPAFAGTNDEHHDRSNRNVSYGEHQDRHHDRSREANHRDEYVKVKVVERKYYSPRDHHQEGHREARRHHEYRGHHQARGHRDNYYHR
jgi:Ni/Co efflux regulator RcnB